MTTLSSSRGSPLEGSNPSPWPLFVLYALAFGLLLVNHGVYWDSWIHHGNDPGFIFKLTVDSGQPLTALLYAHILTLEQGPWLHRLLAFCGYFAAALLFMRVLGSVALLDRFSRFSLAALFALIPVNGARVSGANLKAPFGYPLFFLGVFVGDYALRHRRQGLKWLAAGIFTLSFFTFSNLVFYGLFLLFVLWRDPPKTRQFNHLWDFTRRNIMFLPPPVLFWTARTLWMTPSGNYTSFNQVTPASMLKALLLVPQVVITSFADVLDSLFHPPSMVMVITLTMLAYHLLPAPEQRHPRLHRMLLIIGPLAFFAAIYAYLAVGKLPRHYDWDGRHQLLTPLGIALTLYGGLLWSALKLKLQDRTLKLGMALLIALCISRNITVMLEYQRDWYKQAAIMAHLKTHETQAKIEPYTHFEIDDQLSAFNGANRTLRYYEYTGLLHRTFGDERRMAKGIQQRSPPPFDAVQRRAAFLSDYRPVAPQMIIRIEHGTYDLTQLRRVVHLLMLEHLRPERFKNKILQVIKLTANPIPAAAQPPFGERR
ncbi:MAG: hypothetical protein HQL53_14450 [Magnetococcales bacterium]|nr:hypothetical protein [Magnetococcales bacterium]